MSKVKAHLTYHEDIPTDPGVYVLIHESYAELSACADSSCDLCKFVRRELWFDCREGSVFEKQSYTLRNNIEAPSNTVGVVIKKSRFRSNFQHSKNDILKDGLSWHLCLGRIRGSDRLLPRTDCGPSQNVIRGTISNPAYHLEWARRWLATCRKGHYTCALKTRNDAGFLPKRLLDVGLSQSPLIHLILSKDLNESKGMSYVTLSYCWGSSNTSACTTTENLVQRLSKIDVASLPRTIQDAIVITRGLGVRYLWVDALCMIQVPSGENHDWQRQLPDIGKIYSHSLVTIAASSGKDSNNGIFRRMEAACWPIRHYRISTDNSAHTTDNCLGECFILEGKRPDRRIVVENSPLSKRGWVLQERMLASRTLFCTTEGLFWQCRQRDLSEFDEREMVISLGRMYPKLDHIARELDQDGHRSQRYESKGIWCRLVEQFSQKSLTRPTDRLPAIMGLGKKVAQLTGREYDMGVFTHNLVEELAWFTGFRNESEWYSSRFLNDRDTECAEPKIQNRQDTLDLGKGSGFIKATSWHAPSSEAGSNLEQQANRLPGLPSWTWASIQQKVAFRWDQGRKYLATEVKRNGNQIYARGRLGSVSVKEMRRKSAETNRHIFVYPSACAFDVSLPGRHGYFMQHLAVFDTLEDTLPNQGGTVTCIEWMQWSYGRTKTMTGALILTLVDGGHNVYRRIGWLETESAFFFKDEPQDIVLI